MQTANVPRRFGLGSACGGEQANLELYIVIDDGDDSELGLQYR